MIKCGASVTPRSSSPKRNENVYSHKNLYMNAPNSTICNSQKVETIQTYLSGCMDKQNSLSLQCDDLEQRDGVGVGGSFKRGG